MFHTTSLQYFYSKKEKLKDILVLDEETCLLHVYTFSSMFSVLRDTQTSTLMGRWAEVCENEQLLHVFRELRKTTPSPSVSEGNNIFHLSAWGITLRLKTML